MIYLYSERIKVLMRFLVDLSRLSKCDAKHNAAIIVNKDCDQIYSIGINGGAKGGINCMCNLESKYTCIHAEANAIAKCYSQDTEKLMLCTTSPCITCAAMIINSGFTHVMYFDEYKDHFGIEMLKAAGIIVLQFDKNQL